MKKITFIVCFLAIAAVVLCATTKNEIQQKSLSDNEAAISEQSQKVVACFVANGIWETEPTAYSAAAASVSVAYLLLDNDEVVIIYPKIPNIRYADACRFLPPFSKEEAKIILKAQMGQQPLFH